MDGKDAEEIIDKDIKEQLKYLMDEFFNMKQRIEELEEKIKSMEPNFF